MRKALHLAVAAGPLLMPMVRQFAAHTSFQPEPGSIHEIELAEGDVVEQTGQAAPEGWLHVVLDGIEGIVPIDNLSSLPNDESDDKVVNEGYSHEGEGDASQMVTVPEAGGEAAEDVEGEFSQADLEALALEDANKRVALVDFEAEAGSIYELSIKKGEMCELTDDEAPDGWVAARHLVSAEEGLVPEALLGPAPRRPNAPTQEQIELRKAHEKREQVEMELAQARQLIADLERKQDEAADAAAGREDSIRQEIKVLAERDAMREQAELERIREHEEERSREAGRRMAMDEQESVWPSKDMWIQRRALEEAEQVRLEAQAAFLKAESLRGEAQAKLRDAEQRAEDAKQKLRGEEEARDANSRALKMLPGLRELLAPTQNELKLCVETVTHAVMKNAEDSARLLAKLALSADPAVVLQQASASRREGPTKHPSFSSRGASFREGSGSGSARLNLPELQLPSDDEAGIPQMKSTASVISTTLATPDLSGPAKPRPPEDSRPAGRWAHVRRAVRGPMATASAFQAAGAARPQSARPTILRGHKENESPLAVSGTVPKAASARGSKDGVAKDAAPTAEQPSATTAHRKSAPLLGSPLHASAWRRKAAARKSMPERVRSTVTSGAASASRGGSPTGDARSHRSSTRASPEIPNAESATKTAASRSAADSLSANGACAHAHSRRTSKAPSPVLSGSVSLSGAACLDDVTFAADAALAAAEAAAAPSIAGLDRPHPIRAAKPAQREQPAECNATPLAGAHMGESTSQVWRSIADAAPGACAFASTMDMQQRILRKSLRSARHNILGSRYGQFAERQPTMDERIQQRSQHATYAFMMRQRRARDAELQRRACVEDTMR